MKKIFLALAMLCGVGTAAHAQLDGGIFNHLGVGVGVGTTGIDVEVAAPITNFVQVRAGVSIMPKFSVSTKISMPNEANVVWNENARSIREEWGNNIDFSQVTRNGQPLTAEEQNAVRTVMSPLPDKIEAEGKLSNTQFKLLFDIYPVPNLSFHVTAGFFAGKSDIITINSTNCQDQLMAMTTYNKSLANSTIAYQNYNVVQLGDPVEVKFENKVIRPDGPTIHGAAKVKGFKPYLGIGFGRAVPKKTRLAFACDFGVQFWGKPSLEVMNDKLTEDDIDEDVIKTVEKISVYPTMSFRLCGRIF